MSFIDMLYDLFNFIWCQSTHIFKTHRKLLVAFNCYPPARQICLDRKYISMYVVLQRGAT